MYKIGIIGRGFVGSAVAHGFSQGVAYDSQIKIYDKDPSKSQNTLEEVVTTTDFVFISVPTPSNKDGSISLRILEECLQSIYEIAEKTKANDVIYLVRSTVVPGTTRDLQNKFPNIKIESWDAENFSFEFELVEQVNDSDDYSHVHGDYRIKISEYFGHGVTYFKVVENPESFETFTL